MLTGNFTQSLLKAALTVAFVALITLSGSANANAQDRYHGRDGYRDRGYYNDDYDNDRDHQRRERNARKRHERRENDDLKRHQREERYRYGNSRELRDHQRHEREDLKQHKREEKDDLKHHQRSERKGYRDRYGRDGYYDDERSRSYRRGY